MWERLKFWNTSPKSFLMLCNFFLSTYCAAPDSLSVALSPQYDNVPSSIFSRRVAHLKNVDLPEPDGPIIATTSPSLTSIDISLTLLDFQMSFLHVSFQVNLYCSYCLHLFNNAFSFLYIPLSRQL